MKILVTDGMEQAALAGLRGMGHEVTEQFYAPEELGAVLREYDAVVVRSKTKVRAPQIDAALGGRLKLIIRGGVGLDNIDVAYARQNGITVRNTPDSSTRSVAELALAHLFSCARFISHAGYTMRAGQWEKKAYGKGIELAGKTLGVLGCGRIGGCLADMARGLGMEVLAFGAHHVPGTRTEGGVPYVSLDELFSRSDFISVHAPAGEGGPIIDGTAISRMKDGVCIINTSRGANVDEQALLAALDSGKVRAAGLDVFADEPTKNEALYTHPRVSCTPHIGGSTVEAQARIGEEIVDIIARAAEN